MIDPCQIAKSKDFTNRKSEEEHEKLQAFIITLEKKINELEQQKSDLQKDLSSALDMIKILKQPGTHETFLKMRYHTACEMDQEKTISFELVNYLEERLEESLKRSKTL